MGNITWVFCLGNAAACKCTAAASQSFAKSINIFFFTVGLVRDFISEYSASLSAYVKSSCFFIILKGCFDKNCWDRFLDIVSQSPSSLSLLMAESFLVPSLGSIYSLWPLALINAPNGFSGSSFIGFNTFILSVPDFLFVLNTISTPSGISSEYIAIPFK